MNEFNLLEEIIYKNFKPEDYGYWKYFKTGKPIFYLLNTRGTFFFFEKDSKLESNNCIDNAIKLKDLAIEEQIEEADSMAFAYGSSCDNFFKMHYFCFFEGIQVDPNHFLYPIFNAEHQMYFGAITPELKKHYKKFVSLNVNPFLFDKNDNSLIIFRVLSSNKIAFNVSFPRKVNKKMIRLTDLEAVYFRGKSAVFNYRKNSQFKQEAESKIKELNYFAKLFFNKELVNFDLTGCDGV